MIHIIIYAFVYGFMFSAVSIVCIMLHSLIPVAVVVVAVVLLESRYALQGKLRLLYPLARPSGRQSKSAK